MDMTRNTYEIIADTFGAKLAEVDARLAQEGIPPHESDEVALLLGLAFELSVSFEEVDPEFSSAQWDFRIGKVWREHSVG